MSSNIIDIRDAALACYMRLRTDINDTINRAEVFEKRGMKKTAALVVQGLKDKRSKLAMYKRKLREISANKVPTITPEEQARYAEQIRVYREFYKKEYVNVQEDSAV